MVQGEDPQEGDQPTGFSLGSVMAGVDSSCPRIDRAVAVAAAIARVSGSALNVVHTPCRSEITSRLLRWSQPESGQLPEVESREIRLRVEQVARCAGGKDLEVKQQFLGTADTLCDLVTREKPGLVVLGSHRWSDPLGRHFSGTAARRTIGAPRPMLVLQDLPTKWTRDRWDSPWGRRDAHVERTRKRGP
ncbi:MAG: universal stress protein, partial [Anaerolineae bacterium]|nr:universal stress protein [Anaerolineae bacterium]NIQ81655.1 universal stress protein [Anaerolineae bacterium]